MRKLLPLAGMQVLNTVAAQGSLSGQASTGLIGCEVLRVQEPKLGTKAGAKVGTGGKSGVGGSARAAGSGGGAKSLKRGRG